MNSPHHIKMSIYNIIITVLLQYVRETCINRYFIIVGQVYHCNVITGCTVQSVW